MKTYLSLLFTFISTLAIGQDCSDLFISEYVRGSGNNAALELYNPTPNTIDLSTYSVGRFRDGSGTPMLLSLSGSIQPYSTYVVTLDKRDPNGTGFDEPISQVLEALSDTFVNPIYIQADSPFYFNGDDAIPLFNGDPTNASNLIDLIGRIGEDPGTAWSDANGVWWTRDHTLYRKPDVLQGDSDGLDVFIVEAEWDSLPEDDFSGLGWHDCLCSGFQNITFSPTTASICNNFNMQSITTELVPIPPFGEADFYYDAVRINEIIGIPAGVTATTDVIGTADLEGPYGYWFNSGTAPNQTAANGTLSMTASQATISGLLGGGPNSDGIYPFQVIVDRRVALTIPDISFIIPNGTWGSNASGFVSPDTIDLFLQVENCSSQPCVSTENVLFIGLDASYTVTDAPTTLIGAPSDGVFIGPGISGDSFDPSAAGIGTHGIAYAYVDGNGCVGVYSTCTDVTLTVGGTGGDLGSVDISVYPNPSNDVFTVSVPEEMKGSGYAVYASDGRIINAGVVNANQVIFNLGSEASGTYILSLQTINGPYEMPLIKTE